MIHFVAINMTVKRSDFNAILTFSAFLFGLLRFMLNKPLHRISEFGSYSVAACQRKPFQERGFFKKMIVRGNPNVFALFVIFQLVSL